MAYVTVEWEYGDTSTIEGFRVYRDDELRAEVAPNVRTINDSVDDTVETVVKYEIKAFDSAGRESYGCQYAEAFLLSSIIPTMTSQTEPAGNAYAYKENDPYSNINEGYLAFDGDAGTNVSVQGAWAINQPDGGSMNVVYEFSEAQRIVGWGYKHNYSGNIGANNIKLYGRNLATDPWTPIGQIDYFDGLADGTIMREILNNPVYYQRYRWEAVMVHPDFNGSNNWEHLFSELYLYNREDI
jgi:hypothetical protein